LLFVKFSSGFLILIQAAIFLVHTGGSMAQGELPPQELTAQEYFTSAEQLFASGKYSGAADLYGRLATAFGQSKEAVEAGLQNSLHRLRDEARRQTRNRGRRQQIRRPTPRDQPIIS